MSEEPEGEKALTPINPQEIRKVRTPPLLVTVDENGYQALQDRAHDLWDKYHAFMKKHGDRVGPILNIEFGLRTDYDTTIEILEDMHAGRDFRMAPQVDPETGLVTRVDYESADQDNKIKRSGKIFGHAQGMIDIITTLGVAPDTTSPSIPGVILRPNLPDNIDKPAFQKIPVKSIRI